MTELSFEEPGAGIYAAKININPAGAGTQMKKSYIQTSSLTTALLFATVAIATAAETSYHLTKTIPVGGEGGWDYLSVDSAARRLYVSHGTKAVVIDLDKEEVVGEISDTPGIHGIAVASDLGKGFCSNGRENKVSIVDLKSLKTSSKVETGQNPDAIIYYPGAQEVYAFNGRGQSASVIDAKADKVIATIPLAGKPEFAASDAKVGRIYVNLEDKSQVAVIDAKTHEVVTTWPLAPGEEPSGMAYDPEHHRLFIGCGNKMMVMMDSESGKVLAHVPIGDHVDANAFDEKRHLAFASTGEGTVTIAQEDGADKLTVVQSLKTEPGARTMTIDPKTGKIYLASAKYEAPDASSSGGKKKRPAMVPGSFKILVYSP
jgi:YVTN family beta-propeller protein